MGLPFEALGEAEYGPALRSSRGAEESGEGGIRINPPPTQARV